MISSTELTGQMVWAYLRQAIMEPVTQPGREGIPGSQNKGSGTSEGTRLTSWDVNPWPGRGWEGRKPDCYSVSWIRCSEWREAINRDDWGDMSGPTFLEDKLSGRGLQRGLTQCQWRLGLTWGSDRHWRGEMFREVWRLGLGCLLAPERWSCGLVVSKSPHYEICVISLPFSVHSFFHLFLVYDVAS